ncbi:hypothetical protein BFO_0537 [Tannerella forsythia 92A2]|uniref:Uncharacterized protein n=1 Tax=Tannerella forsythia (strain ATCC 43037 / JCM 10827 / CCUG 21028 A / KCTC 5666 / FDC 338) TaxID=203275 RepID=G8ULF7_TANFA|nr:hypothetical protein BFO_0537 [Tannerella forsythia 92A2]BAR48082.1 hypothetical protein TF3313_0500 [Tannerella forsythia 3313]
MIFRTIKKTKIQKPRKKNGRHRVEKKTADLPLFRPCKILSFKGGVLYNIP